MGVFTIDITAFDCYSYSIRSSEDYVDKYADSCREINKSYSVAPKYSASIDTGLGVEDGG
jgi:hypothetical protein